MTTLITEYDKEQARKKDLYIRTLLKLHFHDCTVRFVGTTCIWRSRNHGLRDSIENYADTWFNYVEALDWTELPKSMRYSALKALAFEEVRVPGGVAYGIKPKIGNAPQVYVFLDISHEIGRCDLVRSVTGVRVH